jgi:hypothetical protein
MENVVPILFLIATLAVWLLVKLFIIFLHVKYKLKISGQLAWSGHLKNIKIVKSSASPLAVSADEKKLQVRIDRLWVSSSLFDRTVDERLAICVNSVNIDYYSSGESSSSSIDLSEKLLSLEKLKQSKLFVRLVGYLRRFILVFLGYFGSLMIDQLKFSVNSNLVTFKIDKFKGKFFMKFY